MRTRIKMGLAVCFLCALLLQACASTQIFVSTTPIHVENQQKRPFLFKNFWDAMQNLNFSDTMNLDGEEKKFVEALQAILKNEVDIAEQRFTDLFLHTTDTLVRSYSKVILEQLLIDQAKWESILNINKTVSKDLSLRSFLSESFSGQNPERYYVGTDPDTLPIEINRFGHILVEVTVQGVPKKFLFDTGSSVTIISSELATEAGIQGLGAKSGYAQTAAGKSVPFVPCIIGRLQIGSTLIENNPAAIIDQSYLSQKIFWLIPRIKINGILGWRVIKKLEWRIDYQSMKVIVSPPKKKENVHPNMFWLGNLFVRAYDTNGTELFFKLDTGGEYSAVTENLFRKLPDLSVSKVLKDIWSAGRSKIFIADVVRELSIMVDRSSVTFKNITSLPQPKSFFLHYDGVLGIDLAKKGVVHIDYTNGLFEFFPYDGN